MDNENNQNQIFCLNYELKTLSDLLIRKKAERWVYGFMDSLTESEHLDRYKFLLDQVSGKNVLDLACGSGYGSYLLAKDGMAKQVIGIDIDKDAIEYGKIKYPAENIKRLVENGINYKGAEQFDIIVSFETIEHIPDYLSFIDNLYNNLIDGGYLYISTPITLETNKSPKNPYHHIEWSFYDFHKLFIKRFEIEKIFLQNVSIIINEWKVPSFFKKIKNRIIEDKKIYSLKGGNFELYNNQYDMNNCEMGYQMLVLKKK